MIIPVKPIVYPFEGGFQCYFRLTYGVRGAHSGLKWNKESKNKICATLKRS